MGGGEGESRGGAARAHIGQWLESGTGPHFIRARSLYGTGVGVNTKGAKALRFGGTLTDSVSHPGTPAYRIMGKTLRSVQPEAEILITRAIGDRAARSMG